MKKVIYYLLTLWGVLSLQALNNHLMGGSPFSIDILLICTLFFGLTRGPVTGQAMGVIWGLLSDVSSLGLVGLNMLLYALAGYGAGMLSRQLDETKLWTQEFLR